MTRGAWSVGAGAVSVVAGVLALTWPGVTPAGLAACSGAAAVAGALVTLGAARDDPDRRDRRLRAVLGVLGVAVGLAALIHPGLTLLGLVVAWEVLLVVCGLGRVEAADGVTGTAVRAVVALVDLVLGVVVLSWPAVGLATLTGAVGSALLARGVGMIVRGGLLRRASAMATSVG